MKKSVIFLLCGLALFFFPSLSYSDDSLCSENDYYCWQIEVITAVASVQSYYNTRAFTDASCSSWTGSGSTLVLAGGTYWKMRKRSRLINGTWGAWSAYYNAGINPGVPPDHTGVFILDACADDRPDPCEIAEKDPIADCGSIEAVTWEDVDTCEYHCDSCDDEYSEATSVCGESNFSFGDIDCLYFCLECDDATDNANTLCDNGWYWTDESKCSYLCNTTCVQAFNYCLAGCQDQGGIYSQSCEEDATGNIVGTPVCECRDDNPNDTEPGVDPEEPVDPPDDDPADDPAEDPDDNDQQIGNKWLGAIKENTDILVEQGNVDADEQAKHTASLDAIAENTKATADNQGNIVDAIEGLGDKLDNDPLDLTKVENKLDDIIENTGIPDNFDPGFDLGDSVATLQEMKDSVVGSFTDYEGVTVDDASWFGTLYTSIIPPTGACVPLDLSVRGHELIIGCQYDSEVKAVMAYFMSILSIITIFQLVRKELIPKTSSG